MTDRATDFVRDWITENVNVEHYVHDGDPRPAEHAQRCLQDAKAAGIPAWEIEDSYPDLVDTMADALDRAVDAEIATKE